MTLIGVVEKKGNYEGRDYRNIMFHCVSEADKNTGAGQIAEVVKVKYDKLSECFGQAIGLKDLFDLIGSNIWFSYDKFGSVNEIRV